MKQIYTAGYQGHTVEQLRQAAEKMDAIVCDIRLSPRSRIPGWSGHEMETALGWRYFHVPDFGNLNFKSGPIKLADPARGLLKVLKFAETTPVVLLCGCREYSSCHRQTCAELFHEREIQTQELEWPSTPVASGKVRCISLWQPWASLIAIGAKQIETRHWSTTYRGPLLIHAAKTKAGYEDIILGAREENGERIVKLREPFGDVLKAAGYERLIELPLGALVCVVDLTSCVRTEALAENISEQERSFGNYGEGRFGWLLENIRAFPKPIPWRGQQGMWDVQIDLEAALRGEVEIAHQEPPPPRKTKEQKQANLF